MKILVTGSTAYDYLINYDGSFSDAINPEEPERIAMAYVTPHMVRHHGGTAPNIAWSLKLLGCNPITVSTVGSDGGAYTALLDERGIGTEYIDAYQESLTATAILGTDTQEQQIIFFHPGADTHGVWPDLNDERDDVAYAIISPRDEVLMMQAVDWCKKFAVPYFFDPGQRMLSFADDDLERAVRDSEGVIVNEAEWQQLQQKIGCSEENILMYTKSLFITRGEAGVTFFTADGAFNVPGATADQVVNPTGAGDAFRAGLLTGLQSGWSLLHAARLGNVMGSYAVEIEGTLIDHIDKDAVWSRAAETYGEQLPDSIMY